MVGTSRLRALVLAALGAALLVGISGGRAAGPPIVPPPLPPECRVEQSARCLETQPEIALVTVAPQGIAVGGTVTATVTPVLPQCPSPATDEAMAAIGRCGGTPVWGFSGEARFVDNLTSGTVTITRIGTCDGSTWSCSFRIDSVDFPQAPGNRDPLPAWVTLPLDLSVASWDPSPGFTRIDRFDVDAPVWVVRPATTGSIEIVKETVPSGDPQSFGFTGLGDFSLDTDSGTALPDRRTFTDLEPGPHTIRETSTPGWQLVNIACNDQTGTTTIQLDAGIATVDLAAGDAVTCTFRNERKASRELVVNVTGDGRDTSVGDGRCDASTEAGDQCTLRAAIQEANDRAGLDTIRFDVPGSGVPTISVGEEIAATDQVAIDGTTQPGGERVELDGGLRDAETACTADNPFHDGLVLGGEGSVVRGLVLRSFPGFALVLGGSGGHHVEKSFIGTDATGTIARGNGLVCGNLQPGTGTGRGGGILANSASNTVGGSGVGNVISGNQVRHRFENVAHCQGIINPVGVYIRGPDTVVEGNIFGLDVSGSRFVDVPNFESSCGSATQTAIAVVSAAGTRIGGASPGARNVITSGDIGIDLSDATGTTIEGNYIGTDGTGTADPVTDLTTARGVAGGGVGTRIVGNVISGNGEGLELDSDVVVEDNLIGVAAVGGGRLGNAIRGVTILGSANRLARNTIAYSAPWSVPNFGQGVAIVGGTGNRLTENRIFGNGTLGIDLAVIPTWGVTPNDAGFDIDSGPNGLQNFPAIGGAVQVPAGVRLSGSMDGAPLTTFSIEVFASTDCDESDHGEGARFLGRFDVTTGVLGDAFIDHTVTASVSAGEAVAATATDPNGSTSEFSECRIVNESLIGLTAPAPAGSTRLAVDATGLVGRVVAIGGGATREVNFGLASGSLILARPTRFAHAAGEPVVATDDTLFVSVDKAVVIRSAKLPDIAALNGRLRAVQGRGVACGEDVTLSLDGGAVAQRVPGTKFTRQSGNRCVFVAKTENGIGRLELDLGKGAWNAQVIRRDLERLTNPVDLGLRIGDDAGTESLQFRANGAVWTYAR
jgi:hypothetical protein